MEKHVAWMQLALTEARKGLGHTHPNPAVGAILVKKGKLLATGYHHSAGKPHAEIEVLQKLSSPSIAKGATLYVTLEPCSTYGKTPPCTEAIIGGGIRQVVYGATDPNPAHAGKGKHMLQAAGIEVIDGVLNKLCQELNRDWNYWIQTKMPYVTAKVGMSLDGRLDSPPEKRWITSAAARRDAMELRSKVDAILIGGETLRADNPQLTIRGSAASGGHQPKRIIWSRSGNLPKNANVFTDSYRDRTIVITSETLREALEIIGKQEIVHVLIEGGGTTLGQAFDQRLVHEVCFYVAPVIQGGSVPAVGGLGCPSNDSAIRLHSVEYKKIGTNLRVRGKIFPKLL